MIIAVWRILAFMLWFGVAFVLCTVVIALVLVLITGAVLMGLFMPSRTVRGQLASVVLNCGEAVAHVKALDPR
jgi:hypothetical protein